MIFIVVKFKPKPEYVDSWLERTAAFTQATRAESGNLWFDWSRSVENDGEFVLVEAFADGDAGAAHVQSDHFQTAIQTMQPLLSETPDIVNGELPGSEWSKMGEFSVD